jgi:hypothetical protein
MQNPQQQQHRYDDWEDPIMTTSTRNSCTTTPRVDPEGMTTTSFHVPEESHNHSINIQSRSSLGQYIERSTSAPPSTVLGQPQVSSPFASLQQQEPSNHPSWIPTTIVTETSYTSRNNNNNNTFNDRGVVEDIGNNNSTHQLLESVSVFLVLLLPWCCVF